MQNIGEVIKSKKIFPPEVILTDWDDTLFENEAKFKVALEKVLKEESDFLVKKYADSVSKKGIKDSVDSLTDVFVGIALEDAFEQLFNPDGVKSAIEIFKTTYKKQKHGGPKDLLSGAEDFLEAVKGYNIPLGAVSNKGGEQLRRDVESCKVSGYFKVIFGFDDVSTPKPDASAAIDTIRAMGFTPNTLKRSWLIGDSPSDIHCAINAGSFPIFVGHEYKIDDIMKKLIEKNELLVCENIGKVADVLDLIV